MTGRRFAARSRTLSIPFSAGMLKVRRERRKARKVPAGIPAYFEETDRRFAARSRTLSIPFSAGMLALGLVACVPPAAPQGHVEVASAPASASSAAPQADAEKQGLPRWPALPVLTEGPMHLRIMDSEGGVTCSYTGWIELDVIEKDYSGHATLRVAVSDPDTLKQTVHVADKPLEVPGARVDALTRALSRATLSTDSRIRISPLDTSYSVELLMTPRRRGASLLLFADDARPLSVELGRVYQLSHEKEILSALRALYAEADLAGWAQSFCLKRP